MSALHLNRVLWQRLQRLWHEASLYLPLVFVALTALGSYWLVRTTPLPAEPRAVTQPQHQPDYFMRGFSLRTFHPDGRLRSEVFGSEVRHFPDTDTLEIDNPRIRTFGPDGSLTTSTARRALSNGDGSEVQLIGDAVVIRSPAAAAGNVAPAGPALEFRGEFLHAFLATERVTSNRPVVIVRGDDRFAADTLVYDHVEQILQLDGRVGVTFAGAAPP